MNPIDYCRDRAAPAGSSLHYALLFTTPDVREDLLALHAFHAEVTSIVEECSDAGVAVAKLGWWREELERVFGGEARHPVGQALQPALRRHGLDREPFEDILAGVGMDLEYGAYPGFRELSVYCHRVGCSTARLAVAICGYDDSRTLQYAHDLGMALQLTRFLRNVRRHAAAGRLYIPEDELRAAGVDRGTLAGRGSGEDTRRLFEQQAERIRGFHDAALERLPDVDRHRQRPATVLAGLYRALLEEIARDGYPLLERRHYLTPLRKLWIAWRIARRQKDASHRRRPE